MSHELYVQALSAMFLFWNGARVLTYLPTIGKLVAREADVRSYSLLSWGSWALSNGTFALMLLEMSRGIPNQMFWMNLANMLMCLVVSFIIIFRRFPWLHTRVNDVYRTIRRNDSKRAAMPKQAELPHSGARSPDADPAPTAPPARFGRLALWVASASALAVGVVGTVAYDIWFHHDQRAYVEAMASAPQALGAIGPTSPTYQTSLSGHVPLSSSPPGRGITVASAGLSAPASSARLDRRATPSPDSAAPQLAIGRPGQASNFATQNRRHSASHVKPNRFARRGLLFPRVSYRQHGVGSQRDPYSHP
jgi:hypothetical protein